MDTNLFISLHSFIQAISIAPLQVLHYSEALPTQHEYCAGISHQSEQTVENQFFWRFSVCIWFWI